jgi:nicotinamide mononucleotide transporter
MNWTALIAVAFALLYVLLAMRESILCWPAAIISSLLYIKIFFEAALYTESVLQLFFIAISCEGLRRWKQGGDGVPQAKIRVQTLKFHLKGITATATLGLMLGAVVSETTGASYAYLDSLITIFSIYTTILVTDKILESWIYWIAIDIVAAALYFTKELYFTSALFGLYVLLAALGYVQWKSRMEKDHE